MTKALFATLAFLAVSSLAVAQKGPVHTTKTSELTAPSTVTPQWLPWPEPGNPRMPTR